MKSEEMQDLIPPKDNTTIPENLLSLAILNLYELNIELPTAKVLFNEEREQRVLNKE